MKSNLYLIILIVFIARASGIAPYSDFISKNELKAEVVDVTEEEESKEESSIQEDKTISAGITLLSFYQSHTLRVIYNAHHNVRPILEIKTPPPRPLA